MILFMPPTSARETRISSGQAGLEPATFGFGDRRSTNWSYWPRCSHQSSLHQRNTHPELLDLRLTVQSVLPVVRAVLLDLELALHVASILVRRVVTAVTLRALECDQLDRALLSLRHSANPYAPSTL